MSYRTLNHYRGWTLVNVSPNFYMAIKGKVRLGVGGVKRGDLAELTRRFRRIVDEREERHETE
jgi:hypothetical protein